ncbi:MAG: 16S rRNA (adenine(1518)-N(6)/adenine(1519)-N(6))-dimethyltransferase RsmA [Solirubrobacterales bacterium]
MSAADSGSARGAHRTARRRAPVRLGQHFLADSNLLEAIVRDAEVDSDDVVLEIGGGEGALTERVAVAARHLHVIELDRGLAERLSERCADLANVSVTHGDAMRLDLSALDPAPTAVVSNLPYSIATPVLLRTIVELGDVRRWTVMVQREIADRLRAGPGSRTYGGPSVLVQLACEVELLRAVDRAVFTPRPRVDSALLGLTRRAAAPPGGLAALVRGAFAHRRKPLAGSLELAGGPTRAEAHEALAAIGIRRDARAEQLAPEDFARLYERLERR